MPEKNADDASVGGEKETPGVWPCFDELDSRLIKIAVPIIGNFGKRNFAGVVVYDDRLPLWINF